MRQIRAILTLAIVGTLLGTSTTAGQSITPSHNRALMLDVTTASAYEMTVGSLKQNRATVSGDAYSFTMTLPKQAGSRFAKLSFSFTKPDRDQTVVPLHLKLQNTTAFAGTSTPGDAIAIKETWIDETGTVWVELDLPVTAKTTLTVVFKTRKPLSPGQYMYSIAAYPNTKPNVPIFVNSGTLRI